MKGTKIDRATFLNSVMTICEISCVLLNTIRHAANYTVSENYIDEVLSCDAYGYEYEFNKTLGCYRFRHIKEGPWTKWRSLEEA